jgi:phage shock protein E
MSELTKELIESATVIDVRTEEEVAYGIFEGAEHICLDELVDQLDYIKTLKAPLVLYCRSGNRSGQACAYLESEGVTEVYNGINLETLEDVCA